MLAARQTRRPIRDKSAPREGFVFTRQLNGEFIYTFIQNAFLLLYISIVRLILGQWDCAEWVHWYTVNSNFVNQNICQCIQSLENGSQLKNDNCSLFYRCGNREKYHLACVSKFRTFSMPSKWPSLIARCVANTATTNTGLPKFTPIVGRLLDRMVCICAEAVAALALLPKLFLMGGVDEFWICGENGIIARLNFLRPMPSPSVDAVRCKFKICNTFKCHIAW